MLAWLATYFIDDFTFFIVGEFNEAKLQKFGHHIIQKVREFCGQTTDPDFANKIQFDVTDDFDEINPE